MNRKAQLVPKSLLEKFAETGNQDEETDPIFIAHYYNSDGPGDWFMIEYDPSEKMFFGYASIFKDWNDEWGYIPLSDLESIPSIFLDKDFKKEYSSIVIKSLYETEGV